MDSDMDSGPDEGGVLVLTAQEIFEPVPGQNRCKHELCIPAFDPEKARGLSPGEVRARWPPCVGTCPQCHRAVQVYASWDHFVSNW